jgi:endo-1,4-beta-xylanase
MPSLSRRDFVRGLGLSASMLGSGGVVSASNATSRLKDIASSRGLLFGSVMRTRWLRPPGNQSYSNLLSRECDLIVCADMHWRLVAPTPDVTDFSVPEAAYAWAHENHLKFRGHTLLWHRQIPPWFVALSDRDTAEKALREHIRTMCTHFAGRMHSWDVVNEAILTNSGRPDGLRQTAFLQLIGPSFLDIAFQTARASDPKPLLVYNEWGVEFDIPYYYQRRRALLNMIDGFRKRGTPIDAIGIQSHLSVESMSHFNEQLFSDFLREIASRGLKIMLTELDVVDRAAPSDVQQRDNQVAGIYRRYLDVALANRSVIAVITWGVTDSESWITRGDEPEFRRADGLPPRPLPFDADFKPKPAYVAIAAAMLGAPKR